MEAITAGKRTQQPLNIGPNITATKNSTRRTIAFHTTGPKETTPSRMRGLTFPVLSNDLTNMYAMMKIRAPAIGMRISEVMTTAQPARGTSPESFSDGWPSLFFLKPVIWVRDKRQYPIHEFACVLELPRDIHRKNSR